MRVVNDALRVGLSKTGKKERTARFVVKPWPLGLKAGIYEGKLGQLLDQLRWRICRLPRLIAQSLQPKHERISHCNAVHGQRELQGRP